MRLSRLLEGLSWSLLHGSEDCRVTDLADHADRVRPGAAFLVRVGATTDGRHYIRDAIHRGAAVVIGDIGLEDVAADRDVTWVRVPMVDQRWVGRLAQRYFDDPGQQLRLIGITGTNGKTTTAWIVRHLLDAGGWRCGMLGTVMNHDGVASTAAELTTPGPIDLARWLARMVGNGCRAAVLEVSSHALDQGRVEALRFDVAVFTNLTGDHLDYHETMEQYAAAKARLFGLLKPTGTAVLNMGDARVSQMCKMFGGRRIACGLGAVMATDDAASPANAEIISSGVDGTRATLNGPWGRCMVHVPLPGAHNVTNTLLASSAASCLGLDAADLRRGLETVPAVPGRLERVHIPAAVGNAPVVLVDYAHTHDALENVLLTVRTLSRGRVIVVFGCGGDRDASKRPKMAAVACRLADRVVLTNDNPRTEDPKDILRDMRNGIPAEAVSRVVEQVDRREAITAAITEAGENDLVLIAGKGHEDYQIIGDRCQGFDDRRVAEAALWVRREKKKASH